MLRKMFVAAVACLVLAPLPAQASPSSIGGTAHPQDPCKSEFIKSLGNPPCETMTDAPRLRCDLLDPVYITYYRFRWLSNGEWSQWWVYYKRYQNAPKKVCQA